MSHEKKVTAVTVNANTRREFALQLRASGLNYREVAEAMVSRFTRDLLPSTYDERYAWRDVQTEMSKLRSMTLETAQQYRLMELYRLDQLQSAIMPDAVGGDQKAIASVLKIMDHRAKLMGLYAPSEVKINDWRSQVIELVKSGKITREDIASEYGEDFAIAVLESGTDQPVEGRFVTEEDAGETKDGPGGEVAG